MIKKTQLFWDIVYGIGKMLPLFLFKDIPDNIIVEPTNVCNLHCVFCPIGNNLSKRKKGFMKLELFKKIIDEFKWEKKKPNINLNFAGEPTLNKNLPEFVRYANENGHKTFVSTNATVLSKKMSKDLIMAGLHSIHLCIDGMSKRSHEAYRRGSNFYQVKKNIENFMKINKGRVKVTIQTLLTSYSEKEIDKLKKWAIKIGADELNLKSMSLGSFTTQQYKKKYAYLLPDNIKYRRKKSKIRKTLCLSPLDYPVIYFNGDIGLCCIDFDNAVKLGNVKKGFMNIIYQDRTAKIRKKAFLKQLKICKNCSIGNADYYGENIKLSRKDS